MTDARVDRILDAVTRAFPDLRPEWRPFSMEDDPSVSSILYLLDAPEDRLAEVEDAALSAAIAEYPEEPIPFVVMAVGPALTAARFWTPIPEAPSFPLLLPAVEPWSATAGLPLTGKAPLSSIVFVPCDVYRNPSAGPVTFVDKLDFVFSLGAADLSAEMEASLSPGDSYLSEAAPAERVPVRTAKPGVALPLPESPALREQYGRAA